MVWAGLLSLAAELAEGTPHEAPVRTAMAAAEQVMDQLEADVAAAGIELKRPGPFWLLRLARLPKDRRSLARR